MKHIHKSMHAQFLVFFFHSYFELVVGISLVASHTCVAGVVVVVLAVVDPSSVLVSSTATGGIPPNPLVCDMAFTALLVSSG